MDYAEFTARIRTLEADYEWMRIRMNCVKNQNHVPVQAICIAEKIAEYKDLENRFTTVLSQNATSSWKYDFASHMILLNNSESYVFHQNEKGEIYNVPESQIEEGICHPDDVKILRRLYQRMENGEKVVEEKLRYKSKDAQEYRWVKCTYAVMRDTKGMPFYAIGSSVDITKQLEAKRQYKAAVEYRKRTQTENLILSGHSSVTKDLILEMTNNSKIILSQKVGDARTAFFEGLETLIIDEQKKKEFYSLFSNDNMIRRFQEGFSETSMTGEISLDLEGKKRLWVNFHVDTVKVPDTGDIEGFLTVTDITEQFVQEKLLNMVVECDYDYVANVNFDADTIVMYQKNELEKQREDYDSGVYYSYQEFIRHALRTLLEPEDIELFRKHMSPEYIREALSRNETYEFVCHIHDMNGQIRIKRARFASYEETRNMVAFTRTDITEIIAEQERKQRELAKALELAEQATRAKTDFLSRMSHDLSTPMNAIIGLSALTIDDAAKPEQVCENMSKLRSASNFMLSLINDILDMAKIENGTVDLHPEPYSYSDFLTNMKTMFVAQCEQKGIEITFMEPSINPVIMVDKTRLNRL